MNLTFLLVVLPWIPCECKLRKEFNSPPLHRKALSICVNGRRLHKLYRFALEIYRNRQLLILPLTAPRISLLKVFVRKFLLSFSLQESCQPAGEKVKGRPSPCVSPFSFNKLTTKNHSQVSEYKMLVAIRAT